MLSQVVGVVHCSDHRSKNRQFAGSSTLVEIRREERKKKLGKKY